MAKKKQPPKKSTRFVNEDPWRVFRIMSEFVEGFDELSHLGPAVTVFGSARTKPRDKFYKATVDLSRRLAENNYAVITGGGPGIMEASNRGASDAGGRSLGLNIVLPHEQHPNAYISPEFCFRFHYFGIRKMHFMLRARAVVVFTGGFGTMDELFEALTLIQTGKSREVPVILVGHEFWRQALNLEFLRDEGLISPEDVNLIKVVDTADQAWQEIVEHYEITPGQCPRC